MTNKNLPLDVDDRYERHFPFLIEFARKLGVEYEVYAFKIVRARYIDLMKMMGVDRNQREPIQKFLDDLLDTRFDESLCDELRGYFANIVSERHKPASEERQSLKASEEKH